MGNSNRRGWEVLEAWVWAGAPSPQTSPACGRGGISRPGSLASAPPGLPAFHECGDHGVGLFGEDEAFVGEYPAEGQARHGGDRDAGALFGGEVGVQFAGLLAGDDQGGRNFREGITNWFMRSRG